MAALRSQGDLREQLYQRNTDFTTSKSTTTSWADPRFEDKIARIQGELDHLIATRKEYELDDFASPFTGRFKKWLYQLILRCL